MKSKILKYIICSFLAISGLYSQSTRDNNTFKGNKNVISKKYNKAEVNYRKSLSKSEKETKASHNLGNVLFENNNYDEAIQEYFKTQKPELEKEISAVFSKLTNAPKKYKGLRLGDDFSIQVERQDGVVLPSHRYSLSAGASQIAATALI